MGFRASGLRAWVFGVRASGFGFQVQDFGLLGSGTGRMQDAGQRWQNGTFHACELALKLTTLPQDLGFRVEGLGFRV